MFKVGTELLQAAGVEEHPAVAALAARHTGPAGARLGGPAVSPTSQRRFGRVRSLYGQLLLLAEDLELGRGKTKSSVRD